MPSLAILAASPTGALFSQIIGIMGLLLGAVGFAVTIWQISNVRSVASAQQQAIAGLSFRLSQLDVIAECTKAESAIADAKHSNAYRQHKTILS